MNQPNRRLLSLWDYGWLDCHEIKLPPCDQPHELIHAYLASDFFETSFVGPELVAEPAIHGPFWRNLISADDFQVIDLDVFYAQIQSIRQSEEFNEPPDEAQWSAVERLLADLKPRFQWLIMLRLSEADGDKFHDWGFVLWVFREFLLANPNSETVTRLVFGYD